jgi:hypothetical protein
MELKHIPLIYYIGWLACLINQQFHINFQSFADWIISMILFAGPMIGTMFVFSRLHDK